MGPSLWTGTLDLARIVAALAVAAGHLRLAQLNILAQPAVSPLDWLLIGRLHDMVMVFFVLSGCVVAMTAQRAESGAAFVIARLSRLWSVALPALLVTILCDVAIQLLNPLYSRHLAKGVDAPPERAWWMLPLSLVFATEWGAHSIAPWFNSPYWSLSYEAAYYLLFAAAMFLAGWRRLGALAGFGWMVGLKVLLLSPVWALGVGVERLTRTKRWPSWIGLLACALALPSFWMVTHDGDLFASLDRWICQALALPPVRYPQRPLRDCLTGLTVALGFAGAAILWRHTNPAPRMIAGLRRLRQCGSATYALYLVHTPVILLNGAWQGPAMATWSGGIMTVAMIGACTWALHRLSVPFDRALRATGLRGLDWLMSRTDGSSMPRGGDS